MIAINKDQAEGRFDELHAKIKKEWGKLTDDELLQARGSTEELVARIQKKYGDTKENITRKLEQFRQTEESQE